MPQKKKYTLELLHSLFNSSTLELIGNYDSSTINNETKIHYKCKYCGLENHKLFKTINEFGAHCKQCLRTPIEPKPNKIYNLTLLNSIFNGSNLELIGNYNNTINNQSKIHYKCISCNLEYHRLFKAINEYGIKCKQCHNKPIEDNHLIVKTPIKPNKKYTLELLNSIILNYNAILIGNYNNTINNQTKIHYKCCCGNDAQKQFRNIKKFGAKCKQCLSTQSLESPPIEPKPNKIYNPTLLYSLFNGTDLELIGNYDNSITGNTYIQFKCISCNLEYKQLFRSINEYGASCKQCFSKQIKDNQLIVTGKNKKIRHKFNGRFTLELLNRLIIKDNAVLIENYNNPINSHTLINFKCHCGNSCKKLFSSIEEFGAICRSCSKIVAKTNREKALFNKYGVTNISQHKESQEKKFNTFLNKYGVVHPLRNREVMAKLKNTVIQTYGVNHIFQLKDVRNKINNTNILRYGVVHPLRNSEVMAKLKNTVFQRYGVYNVTQNSSISEIQSKKSYKTKNYKLPSGNLVNVQGYEPWALDILLKIYSENQLIISDRTKVPEIWWLDSQGKQHRYFADIFIPEENRLIEVKSTWTYNRDDRKDKIKEVPLKCISLGYKYEYWVFNRTIESLEIIREF